MDNTFYRFVDSVAAQDGSPTLCPRRLAEALAIPLDRLAKLCGVHRNTVSQAPHSDKLQRSMRDVLRVLSAAYRLGEGPEHLRRTLFWFRNFPIPDFGHVTPMQMVERGRAQAVIFYVESLSAEACG